MLSICFSDASVAISIFINEGGKQQLLRVLTSLQNVGDHFHLHDGFGPDYGLDHVEIHEDQIAVDDLQIGLVGETWTARRIQRRRLPALACCEGMLSFYFGNRSRSLSLTMDVVGKHRLIGLMTGLDRLNNKCHLKVGNPAGLGLDLEQGNANGVAVGDVLIQYS